MGKKHLEIKNTEFISSHMWLKLSSVDRFTSHYHNQLRVKIYFIYFKAYGGKIYIFLCHETKIPFQ